MRAKSEYQSISPESTFFSDLGLIEIKNVSIQFNAPRKGRIEALAPTDLKIEPGSFISLIGPSGCGKSTLLNAVGGFVPLTTGTIELDGEPIKGINPDVVLRLTYKFHSRSDDESFNIIPHWSGSLPKISITKLSISELITFISPSINRTDSCISP